jgi:hypothetical protein
VALQVLPDLWSSEPDRLARFQREAQVPASLSRTEQQAMMTSTFFMTPMMYLSGFIFPIESRPA